MLQVQEHVGGNKSTYFLEFLLCIDGVQVFVKLGQLASMCLASLSAPINSVLQPGTKCEKFLLCEKQK